MIFTNVFEYNYTNRPLFSCTSSLKYLVNLQQKRAKEREEEQKKGIIRTHYTIKTEKTLTIIFVFGILFTGGCTVASAIQQDDIFPPWYLALHLLCFL